MTDYSLIKVWINAGIQFQNNGKFYKALLCFVQALELDPNRIDVCYQVGRCWQNLGLLTDAIASYNACYKRSQTQQNLWLQAACQFCLGQCYVSLQQQDDAVSAYSWAYQLFSQIGNNPHIQEAWDYLNGVGNSWLDQKNYQASIQYYQRLVKLVKSANNSQHLGWVWHGLGRGFSGDGLDELALECYQQMLDISRDLSDWQMEGTALYWLAWESWKLGKLEDAIAYYEGAIAVYEKQEQGKGWLGVIGDYLVNLYQQTGDFEKAIAVLEKKLARLRESQDKSGEYGLLYQIGKLYYYQLKDYNRAFDYYQSALKVAQGLTPRQPLKEANAYYWLGLISDSLNQSEDAISYFEEALSYYEQDDSQQQWFVKSLDYIEKLSEKIGDSQKLIAVAEKRLILLREGEDKSGEYSLVYKIAGLYYKQKNYSQALKYYQSALEVAQELTPRQPRYEANAYYMLGLMCEFLGRLEEGLANYREGLRLYTELDNQELVERSQQKINSLEELLARRASASRSESDPQLDFLLNVLQVVADSKGDAKVVYSLLQQNLDKLDENLADILRTWATAKFKEVSTETAAYIARSIVLFSSLILEFPLGQHADNLEIAIACYQATLEVYIRTAYPEQWAATQNILAVAYSNRIRGERADNLEIAIACYQATLEVYTRSAYPEKWAETQNNFGTAYLDRIRGERADNLEIAIACYQATLEVYTRSAYPEDWAITQNNLANAYNNRIKGERAENIEKAIAYCKIALEIRTREALPEYWADTQINLANAYWNRIKGEKSDNIEKAIIASEAALEIRTREAFPEQWAIIKNNLAVVYQDRIKGEKAENIEQAIACCEAALEVRTRTAYPEQWAETQSNLGNAYNNRIRGERAENIEMAIAAYQAALEIRTRQAFPESWAMTNNNLAAAYWNRIKGEKADNIERAIAFYQDALEIRTREAFPEDWAETNNNLAAAYKDRIKGEKADNIEKAIAYYKAALEVRTRKAFPQKWADTQSNLGTAYSDRIRGERAENLEIAIACYEAALEIKTREALPESWADTQNNLAAAYKDRIKGEKADNIEVAIAACEATLEIRTREGFPESLAMTQNNLGLAYSDRILGERAENIEKAIACYQATLEVRTREAFPQKWADTQSNLGNAYNNRIRGERAENLEIAIACHEAVLKVYTRTAYPEYWAGTQNNLGLAYNNRILGEGANNLEIAITYYKLALEVYTSSAYPEQWATTQHNLGLAYSNRIRGEGANNLEIAIAYYKLALEVYTRSAYPEQWATTQHNLGSAYSNRIRGERPDNWEIAIAYYEAALEVRTRTAYPQYWADTQNNLGTTYYYRIRGERAENLEKAIACYKLALEVRTRTAYPYNYVETSFNLGLAYQKLKQWQLAYDTFDNAIETLEEIRAGIVKGGDADKQKLAEEWQKLYQAMVEVCIELKNYTAAIEYVERSKTRNLVELLATRDLYPKGDIPQTVLDELTRLRRDIETEQRRLEIEERNRDNFGGGTTGERSPNITIAPTSPPDRRHLNQLQQQLDTLINRDITPIDPDFRRSQKVQPMPFAEIQALTGENTAILEWYILSDRFLVFIVTPPTKPTATDGERVTLWQSSPADYQQLIKWADDYLNSYQNRTSQDWKNSLISRLQKLGEILHINELIATIEKTAKKCDRLVLIPNRFLHLFPLHAIPLDLSGGNITYLMDRFSGGVSYAPSCQLLQTANNRDRQNFSELFAIQNPTEDLEFTNLEVQTISSYFQPRTTLVKEQATKTELNSQQKTKLKTAHCHHFSCHGYFNFTNPLLSALLLANCYLQPPPSPIDRSRHLPVNDNKTVVDLSQCLTLGDVFTLDLRSCRLVTLSACETGLIDILSNSDEYIGLPSGFLVAGSTNVVSSLWAVSDISTALLMIRFYQLLGEGDNVAIALNSAQKWLRNVTKTELLNWINPANKMKLRISLQQIKDDKPFASPYYWGAFCAVGKLT